MNILLERVYSVCNAVREENVNPISFKKLVNRLRKEFKRNNFDLSIRTKKDNSLDSAEFYVMAYYDAEEDYNNETAIEVVVHHSFSDSDQFSKNQITEFLQEIFDATVHEYRHQQQSEKRGYRICSIISGQPYIVYLQDPDEVDAYALSIAIELLRTIGEYKAKVYLTKITALSKIRQGPRYISPTLCAYIHNFGLNRLGKRLAKKIYKHLETIDTQYIFV
jgi:hypothetical protein